MNADAHFRAVARSGGAALPRLGSKHEWLTMTTAQKFRVAGAFLERVQRWPGTDYVKVGYIVAFLDEVATKQPGATTRFLGPDEQRIIVREALRARLGLRSASELVPKVEVSHRAEAGIYLIIGAVAVVAVVSLWLAPVLFAVETYLWGSIFLACAAIAATGAGLIATSRRSSE